MRTAMSQGKPGCEKRRSRNLMLVVGTRSNRLDPARRKLMAKLNMRVNVFLMSMMNPRIWRLV